MPSLLQHKRPGCSCSAETLRARITLSSSRCRASCRAMATIPGVAWLTATRMSGTSTPLDHTMAAALAMGTVAAMAYCSPEASWVSRSLARSCSKYTCVVYSWIG
ncbi:hypothetical protein K437DRAFT_72618 [Tilletiaria anomala UBC 951]|uniref:Uncharacterized protein n=1 Tax=Tilletiaria anomala (strain ATCC 24038 / CBS 436.72 / UBC 951) TaxID=1037660 RepID=A0A066WLK1_TILAU|nr:uncharacterized protein K437DRAFT_72618 [Tilletiaria anomala UBC 951]KDN53473.1 hypothetical protein K437DRAFT_72618 [Tilletiaria anomala UBC 951]